VGRQATIVRYLLQRLKLFTKRLNRNLKPRVAEDTFDEPRDMGAHSHAEDLTGVLYIFSLVIWNGKLSDFLFLDLTVLQGAIGL